MFSIPLMRLPSVRCRRCCTTPSRCEILVDRRREPLECGTGRLCSPTPGVEPSTMQVDSWIRTVFRTLVSGSPRSGSSRTATRTRAEATRRPFPPTPGPTSRRLHLETRPTRRPRRLAEPTSLAARPTPPATRSTASPERSVGGRGALNVAGSTPRRRQQPRPLARHGIPDGRRNTSRRKARMFPGAPAASRAGYGSAPVCSAWHSSLQDRYESPTSTRVSWGHHPPIRLQRTRPRKPFDKPGSPMYQMRSLRTALPFAVRAVSSAW